MPALALLAALGGCQTVQPPAAEGPSTWSPQDADLLFTSSRSGNPEVHILPAGAKEWVNLTRHPARDNWPEWSPDGSRIAFQSDRSGNLDVWLMDADGSNPVQLTDHAEPDYLPSWSPDGTKLLFTSWRTEGTEERSAHIYVMNADGSEERRVVQEALGTSGGATWSPDGSWMVFSRRTGGEENADLFVANSEGLNERRLTSDADAYNGSAVVSPDGSRIAFYSARGEVSALDIINSDGTGRRTLLAEGNNWYPRWSPDGRWLVFTAAVPGGDEGDVDILAIEVEAAATPQGLVVGPGRDVEGRWRPGT